MAFTRQQASDLQPLDPAAAVASSVKLLRAALPTAVSIVADLPANLPTILADATQMHQLVMNLVTNGAQAMGTAGGRLTIALERMQVTDELAVPQRELFPGEYVRLVVADTGTGMDTATLSRIFEPFFTTKPPGQGTGLGLSVVHGIVRSHAGAILVDSQPGRGTTFQIYLPTCHGPLTAEASESQSIPHGHGEHILFVDDEAPLVEANRELLERLGYRVTGVSDPIAAISLFRIRPADFDLVMTDLLMPKLSGTELAQELLRIRPGVPILLNTGFAGRVTPETARAIGVYGLLSKPTAMGALARAVHGAITRPPPFPHDPSLLP